MGDALGPSAVGPALARAEAELRALGLTGAQAFDALIAAIVRRLDGATAANAASDRRAVDAIASRVPLSGDVDLLGLAYESFFPDLFKRRAGQYFTPPAIARLLYARLKVRAGEQVLDPTCGSGGLLVPAVRLGAHVRGVDVDPQLVQLAQLNLRLAGGGHAARADAFVAELEPADVVVANPPFSVLVRDRAALDRFALTAGKPRATSDALFCAALASWLRPGGRAAVVLPWSLVVNPTFASLRALVVEQLWVTAVCELPEGVFRPFGGAAGRAAIVWLARHTASAPPVTVVASLADPGYDVRSVRLRATSDAELDARCRGHGFTPLVGGGRDVWWPVAERAPGVPILKLAAPVSQVVRRAGAPAPLIELADADKATGEVPSARVVAAWPGAKQRVSPGDVLISRLRPELGNVAIVPPGAEALGSAEWIALRPHAAPHALLALARTPSFRDQLAIRTGQTHPRTSTESVLSARVRVPSVRVRDALDRELAGIFAARAAARARLAEIQRSVDDFAAGAIDERALAAVLGLPDEEPR